MYRVLSGENVLRVIVGLQFSAPTATILVAMASRKKFQQLKLQ